MTDTSDTRPAEEEARAPRSGRLLHRLMRFIPLIAPLLLWAVPCWVLLYGGQRWPLPVTLSGTALFALGLVGVPLAMARGHGRRRQDRAAIIGDTLLGASWVLFTWSVLLGVLLRPALAVAGAGHTHGGQIWPFHHLVRLDQPALAGLSRHGARTLLYTSRGTGFWGPPFRVFAPSEITLLVLRSPHPPASS